MDTHPLKTIDPGDTVTISSGQTESAAIDCIKKSLVGINFPSGFDGSSIFFKSSDTLEGSYNLLTDINGQLIGAHAIGANARVRLGDILESERYIKIVSNATESANRDLTLIFKRPFGMPSDTHL